MISLRKAILEKQYGVIFEYCIKTFCIDISFDELMSIISQVDFEKWDVRSWRRSGYSDCTYSMKLKSLLDQNGLIKSFSENEPSTELYSCKLNVGFVGIEETEGQLALLRRSASEPVPEWLQESRSRFFNSLLKLRPIDRVAFRVAGQDPFNPEKSP